MKRQIRNRSSKPKLTRHRRAINDPKIRARVIKLQQQWDSLNRVERGDRLQELTALGCSTRGLAEALGIPDRTIGRHIEIAELPEIDRRAIIAGESTKKVLDKNTVRKRQRREAGRLSYDRDTGILSDQVADIILTFCAGGEKHPQSAVLVVEFEMFLRRVRAYLEILDLWNAPRIRVSKKLGLAAFFKRLRPPERDDVIWFEHQAEWLARVLRTIAKERSILGAGLEKAESRAEELARGDDKTLEQHYWARVEHLHWITHGPPVHPPKIGGKLKRQGTKAGKR